MPHSPDRIARDLEETGKYRSGPLRQWFYRAELPNDPDNFYTYCNSIFLREQKAKAAFKN